MHWIPSTFNGYLFLGTTLEQVCFFQFSIGLTFISYDCIWTQTDNRKLIQIEGEWILRHGNEVMEHVIDYPMKSSKLLCAIGKKVIKFDINREKNSILLHFESNINIEILDTPNYEAYRIDDGEHDFIV